MKHLKIYEDYGFDRPTIHEDDDLFDDIMNQIGAINIEPNADKKYWTRNINSTNDDKIQFIRWSYREELDIEQLNYQGIMIPVKHQIMLEKKIKNIKNILDRSEPDIYSCKLGDHKLDVSEEKIKYFFDKLEKLENQKSIISKKEFSEEKRKATFNALRKRENEIIDKDAKKYNL